MWLIVSEFPRVKWIVPAEMKIFHYNDNDDENDKHTWKKMVIGLNNQPVKPSAADQDCTLFRTVHFSAAVHFSSMFSWFSFCPAPSLPISSADKLAVQTHVSARTHSYALL